MLRLPHLAPALLLGATLAAQDQIIQVPGTDATVRLWTEDGARKSAVSRDGGRTWFEQYAPRYELSFRHFVFDPADSAPTIPPQLMAPNDHRLFYVQFVTDIIPEYRAVLERMGVEVLYHFPYQSYIVRMDRGEVSRVQDHDFVRVVADMHVAYKLEQRIITDVVAGAPTVGTYDIMLANKRTDAGGVADLVEHVGGELVSAAHGGILVTARLRPEQVSAVAADSRVLWIETLGPAELDIDNFRIVAGVDGAVAQIGQEFGRGLAGHIVEGVHSSHCEFDDALTPWRGDPVGVRANGSGPGSASSHGTNTAGEIYAWGVRPDAKGILPYAQMYWTSSSAISGTNNRYPQTQTLTDPSDTYKVSFQTASWGYPRSTQYTSRSAEMDDILTDFDLLVTNSQSNSGSTPSRPQAWAKNVIGVGGFNHFNNTSPTDDCHCNTGSTGPAADGRVGVTFASFYDSILTTSGGSCSYSSSFGGTSGATPTINGVAGATIEMVTDGLLGGPAADVSNISSARANRFAIRPHYTTTRALLTLGTNQLDMTQATRVEQGWGRPNVETLYNNRDKILMADELDVLTQGQTANYIVWVPGTSGLRVSMHHAEEEAVPNAIPTRHNSVDLTLTDPTGAVWRGNAGGILSNKFSQTPSGTPNDVDIHENIFIQNPAPRGIYVVGVTAATITMDNHKETPAMDLDFGLAVRGVGGGRDTSDLVMTQTSNSFGQWDLAVANVPATGWTEGLTFFSLDDSRAIGHGRFLGMEPDALSIASVTSPAAPGNPFHFTNSAGNYPFTGFSFPFGVAAVVQGLSIDAITVLFDGSGNVTNVSNVDRITIQ